MSDANKTKHLFLGGPLNFSWKPIPSGNMTGPYEWGSFLYWPSKITVDDEPYLVWILTDYEKMLNRKTVRQFLEKAIRRRVCQGK